MRVGITNKNIVSLGAMLAYSVKHYLCLTSNTGRYMFTVFFSASHHHAKRRDVTFLRAVFTLKGV